jgi:hypothetical protein
LGFSASELPPPASSGHVCRLGFSRLARPSCGCTTHFWRVYRHRHDDGREPLDGFLRPRNISVPAYRPTHTRGCTWLCASELQVRGRGSPPEPGVTRAGCTGAAAGVHSHAPGQGTAPLCSCAFTDAGGGSLPSTVVRLTPGDPVRLQARLPRSPSPGDIGPDGTPCRVSTGHRRHARVYGPGP